MPLLQERLPELIRTAAAGTSDPQSLLDAATPLGPAGPVLTRLATDPPTGARDALYFLTVGSKNQDPRGAFLDGELSYVVAGLWSLAYYPDFLVLMANTEWIEKQEQFEELITVEAQPRPPRSAGTPRDRCPPRRGTPRRRAAPGSRPSG
jgi:hypothetical protein